MKQKFVELYMDWAIRVSNLSHAIRLKVGAVIVKDDTVISYGYNGTPAGWDNNCEDIHFVPVDSASDYESMISKGYVFGADKDTAGFVKLITRPEVLHAERNALDKLSKRGGTGSNGASMFTTHAPCLECAKSIYVAGIKEVYYNEDYRSNDGIYFLKKCNVHIERISKINT